MSNVKLNGIIDAIEQEVKMPSPSHNNLARLVVLALREVSSPEVSVSASVSTPTEAVVVPTPKIEPEPEDEPKPKKAKRFRSK